MSDTSNKLADEAYKLALPRNYYRLKCLEASDEKTKTGNKMIKFKLEIIPRDNSTPTVVNDINIDGLVLYANSVVTDKSMQFHNDVRSAFGLNKLEPSEVEQAVAMQFKGLECFALCQGSSEIDKQADGTPIVDPYTNKPRVVTKREVVEFVPRPE